ncbi:TraB/GumN family protein [Prosthecomicrobium sp. N25]|uniref:TraB/GumN family protein n=1 Tax=Prosthecomicrobium sp. N25 TaxID=3129254 RepID=UPI0030769FD1
MRALRLLPLIVAALLSAPAEAAPPVCGGRDLLAEMKTADPVQHAAILASGAAVENGEAGFWRIDPPNGAAPSWLLGTAHLSDPRILDLPPARARALDGARVVALENTNVLDPALARAAYGEGLTAMVYQDGRTLAGVIGPEAWAAVKAEVERRGIPGWAVMGWKPWILSFGLLMYPPCELQRWIAGVDFLDIAIGKRAKAAGKPVVDLETVIDQFQAIDAMSEAEQIAFLRALVAAGPRLEDLQETTVALYRSGRVGLLWATAVALFRPPEGGSGFAEGLLRNASFRRNHAMAATARPLIDGGNAFLAVGALHLVGEEGLVALLRRSGYRLTAVP